MFIQSVLDHADHLPWRIVLQVLTNTQVFIQSVLLLCIKNTYFFLSVYSQVYKKAYFYFYLFSPDSVESTRLYTGHNYDVASFWRHSGVSLASFWRQFWRQSSVSLTSDHLLTPPGCQSFDWLSFCISNYDVMTVTSWMMNSFTFSFFGGSWEKTFEKKSPKLDETCPKLAWSESFFLFQCTLSLIYFPIAVLG